MHHTRAARIEQARAGECTCDGGPFQHGPAGRDQVLAQIRQDKQAEAEAEAQGEEK